MSLNMVENFEYYESNNIIELNHGEVFVFGSNLAGRHGAGAAKVAMNNFGAKYGVGKGYTGKCYAIPTKDEDIETLSLIAINYHVSIFLWDAELCPKLDFIVTKIGCGLAGYKDSDIAPMFRLAPPNCKFHKDWYKYLE